ncbi:MAG: hypothetical protein ACFE94_11820 [Candidatus Hodarchaeota archaeon]
MKISRRNRPLVLISLILFPMAIMLCSFSLNAQAGPPIPEPDPKNGWYWDVDVGNITSFECEFIITNATTGEVSGMWRDIWIYNITSIEDVTIDWLGTQEFSQVNATMCYYNVTDGVNELEAYGESSEFALFGYNNITGQHKIRAGSMGMPLLLPKNGSSLEVDILAPIINETFYYPMGQMAFNKFDQFAWDNTPNVNRIHFWNSTPGLGYYSDGYYFDNGTLNYGEAYLWVNMDGNPMYINATMKQVFNYDITDELVWGVSEGEVIYYDSYEGPGGMGAAVEMMVNITNISDVLLNKTKNSFSDEDSTYMVFQAVFADRYYWNGTEYKFIDNNIIGAANNFYPQYYDEGGGGPPIMPFIWPISAPLEDYEFMWNLDTLRIWEQMFYDEIYITENGFLDFLLKNSTGVDSVEIVIDKATGVTQKFLMISPNGIMLFEKKFQTLIEWSVKLGDVLYYKNNEKEFQDVKLITNQTGIYYANISDLCASIGLTLPPGQPEHQFFSCINASFEIWNYMTDSWVPEGVKPFAMANIYWPISPLLFGMGGPPLFLPKGTTSSELSDLFDVYSSVYDDITYNPGQVILRNTALNRELNFNFDEISGNVTMMYGWRADPVGPPNWKYISYYPKFYEELTPAVLNHIVFNTDFPISGLTVSMDITAGPTGAGAALIYTYFPMNPVNVSLPEGTPIAYFDQLLTHWTLITGNITMTLTLPLSIDINNIIPYFYAFNMSGTLDWDQAPPEFYANNLSFDNATNSIIIEMEPSMFFKGIISAISYKTIEEALEEIPGYDLFLLSMMIIIFSGLVIRKVRKEK